ncbi:at hook domain-containing protein family protein [Colletotrichum karsti]|uniref:At hook domain-containing protein family protein n=1 Tax=Colletotrichum karsti TaxID=1095194 RepID=A0A9P6I8M3_9PEZI|nr:at hook domain-containing protein family protein [Colletotrichum karsti]KAF9877955.1 at hook domain-containing protein family protein [Colletotrichum karsti]
MVQIPEAVVVSPRRTRQRAKLAAAASTADNSSDLTLRLSTSTPASNSIPKENGIRVLPEILIASLKLKDLRKRDLQLLLKKRRLLQAHPVAIPKDIHTKGLTPSIMATLVFAQEEAGTAVCISPTGLLLTCSHCIAETPSEFDQTRSHWLLFASGQVVEAVPLAWDAVRDLALLKIVAAQQQSPSSSNISTTAFPFITPATSPPPIGSRLICVGHPGSEDLEAAEPGVETGYDVLHLSTGTFRGCAEGQDAQDNSEIGALMHTCWTYWGHSGAPLIERKNGGLVGLHSSWDDETGMRRGVALEAIRGFLEENKQHRDG